jgi:hypothetical protein
MLGRTRRQPLTGIQPTVRPLLHSGEPKPIGGRHMSRCLWGYRTLAEKTKARTHPNTR